MDPNDRERGKLDLAAGLQHSTSIQTLELKDMDLFYTIPILEGLQFNSVLRNLIVKDSFEKSMSDSPEFSRALQEVLQSQFTAIQRLDLKLCSSDSIPTNQLRLKNCASLSEFNLNDCRFGDGSEGEQDTESTTDFRQMIEK